MSIRHPQLIVLLAVVLPALGRAQQPLEVRSPNGQLHYSLAVGEKGQLTYAVSFRDLEVIRPSALGLELENQPLLGESMRVVSSSHGQEDETYEVPAGKSNPVRNHYNWLKVDLEELGGFLRRRLTIEARAYDDGVAFRYVTIARRRGKAWFVGSMTDWTGRDLEIPLSFLGDGDYLADIYADAPEAAADPKRVTIERDKAVNSSASLKARLAPGGGYAVHIRPRP